MEARAKMQRELLAREKERKEKELRDLAMKARMDRLGGGSGAVAPSAPAAAAAADEGGARVPLAARGEGRVPEGAAGGYSDDEERPGGAGVPGWGRPGAGAGAQQGARGGVGVGWLRELRRARHLALHASTLACGRGWPRGTAASSLALTRVLRRAAAGRGRPERDEGPREGESRAEREERRRRDEIREERRRQALLDFTSLRLPCLSPPVPSVQLPRLALCALTRRGRRSG